MGNSEDMQAVIMQPTIQAAMVAVEVMRGSDLTIESHTRRNSPEETQRPRQAGPLLRQPKFDWKVPDWYVELLNLEMDVSNILQMKMYNLNNEEKVSIIKKLVWLRRGAVHTDSY